MYVLCVESCTGAVTGGGRLEAEGLSGGDKGEGRWTDGRWGSAEKVFVVTYLYIDRLSRWMGEFIHIYTRFLALT